jgi:hypothetical protein
MCNNRSLVSSLQQIPWFRELEPQQFDRLMQISALRTVQPSEILFEGDLADYDFVLDGKITIRAVPGQVALVSAGARSLGWSVLHR